MNIDRQQCVRNYGRSHLFIRRASVSEYFLLFLVDFDLPFCVSVLADAPCPSMMPSGSSGKDWCSAPKDCELCKSGAECPRDGLRLSPCRTQHGYHNNQHLAYEEN
jgi:hypothetical protein